MNTDQISLAKAELAADLGPRSGVGPKPSGVDAVGNHGEGARPIAEPAMHVTPGE